MRLTLTSAVLFLVLTIVWLYGLSKLPPRWPWVGGASVGIVMTGLSFIVFGYAINALTIPAFIFAPTSSFELTFPIIFHQSPGYIYLATIPFYGLLFGLIYHKKIWLILLLLLPILPSIFFALAILRGLAS